MTNDNIKIRLAKYEDYSAVAEIVREVHSLHVKLRPDIYEDTDNALSLEEYKTASCRNCYYVAEFDGKIAGILFCYRRNVISNTHVKRKILYIDTLAVKEEYNRRGVGTALLDFAKELYTKYNYDGFELQVNAKNTVARGFYEKYGFTEKSINLEFK